jgi:hypothetical protein
MWGLLCDIFSKDGASHVNSRAIFSKVNKLNMAAERRVYVLLGIPKMLCA